MHSSTVSQYVCFVTNYPICAGSSGGGVFMHYSPDADHPHYSLLYITWQFTADHIWWFISQLLLIRTHLHSDANFISAESRFFLYKLYKRRLFKCGECNVEIRQSVGEVQSLIKHQCSHLILQSGRAGRQAARSALAPVLTVQWRFGNL